MLKAKCLICKCHLRGRQTRFCSRGCKNRHTNYHHSPRPMTLFLSKEQDLAITNEADVVVIRER